jgi:hypothetical protein
VSLLDEILDVSAAVDLDPAVTAFPLATAAAPDLAQPEVFEIEREPLPDISAGDGHSSGGHGLCLGEDLRMRIFREPIFRAEPDGKPSIRTEEVRQGHLANCPLPAVLAAMAHVEWSRRLLDSMIGTRQVRVVAHRKPAPYESCPSGSPPAKGETYVGKQLVTIKFRRRLSPSASTGARPGFLSKIVEGNSVHVSRALYYQVDLGDELFYASSSRGALWPSLIEKAYAIGRGNNSYEGLDRFLYPHLVEAFDGGADVPVGLDPLDVLKDVADTQSEARAIGGLGKPALRAILGQHGSRPTVADTRDDFEAQGLLIPDHTFAIVGFSKPTDTVTLFNAAGGITQQIDLALFRDRFDNVFFTRRDR